MGDRLRLTPSEREDFVSGTETGIPERLYGPGTTLAIGQRSTCAGPHRWHDQKVGPMAWSTLGERSARRRESPSTFGRPPSGPTIGT